jgi:tRNA threonylcarbamoyladenosine biosynthesis protein TsaB
VSERGPLLLALDTSTATAGVALYDGRQVLAETSWLAGRAHMTALLGEVQATLARAGVEPEQLTGLAVAHGPGSFTGVRVGVSVAKGMAVGLGVPLWGIGTLEVLARAGATADRAVRAVLEAGRGRFVTALFAGERCLEPPRNVSLEELVELARAPALVVGELTAEARLRLERETPAELASPAASLRRAGYLAELAWLAAARGDAGDPALVDAVYVARS